MIVDSQVHVWAAETPERPWRAGRDRENVHLPDPFGYEDLLREMDANGIDRAVLVPPGWEGDRIDFVLEGVQKHPDRFAAMGRIPVELPGARDMLDTWLDQPGMLGVRLSFQHELNRHFMADGTIDWFWPEAEARGIPIMLFAPHWLERTGRIAARHPRLKIIIDHMGLYRQKDAEAAAAIAETAKLAIHPNIFVKVSSAPLYSSEDYPYRNLHVALRDLIEAFGPQRCFWGSDLTRLLNRRKCKYSECLHLFTEELDFLTPSNRDWVMGRGILQCLGWTA
jgi:predicted TIM-barrel fold metal-dependent hydrolase